MAHSNRRPLRAPSAEELYQVREYSSRLEYAFKVRPPVAAKSRRRWEIHFKQDLYRLITVLGSATFDELPAFAIGCVWEHNRRRQPGAEPFDIETIRAADKEHPARKNGPGRLRYQPARDGPNGLLPEQGLKSIWWDEFRQPTKSSSEVADGANSEGEDEVEDEKHSEGPRPRRAAARAPRATRSSSRETRQRKLNAGDPPDVQDSPPNRSSREARSRKPHTDSAPPVEAPQPNQPPAGVSQKAAGKRKAGSTSSTSASAQSLQAHHLGLKKSIEEHIEYEFRNHPTPCETCAAHNQPCRVNFLWKSTCESCSTAKVRCSISFRYPKDNDIACYVGFVYYKMIGNPTLYGTPDFAPPNLPKPLPARESIRWFTDLIDQSKKGKKRGRKPVADASVDEPAHDAPVSRRARSVRPAKDSAASSAVSAPAVSAGEPSGRMAPPRKSTRPRMRSESRQPSPGSSTLRETPLSAASTPPPSPSAASTTSHAVPAPSDAEAEDVLPVQNRKKGKAAAKPSGQARRSALKPTLAGVLDGDSSVPEEDVTVSRSEEWGYDGTCYYFASEGIGNDSWLTYCSSGPDAEVVLDAVEDIANLQDGLGVGLEDDGGGADDHGLEGAPAQRRSLRLAPGSRARAHASTALKAPMPPPAPLVPPAPTRPTTPILSATYLPLSVPVLSGSWRDLPRVGKRKQDGHYAIVLPPHPQNPSSEAGDLRACETESVHLSNSAEGRGEGNTLESRPCTPPGSTYVFARPVQKLVAETKEKYHTVAALAESLELESASLSVKTSSFLERHGNLARRVQERTSWEDGIAPLVRHTSEIIVDLNDVMKGLSHLYSIVAGISDAFSFAPPIPVNWIALVEMLETAHRLKELHEFSWEKLDSFRASVEPLQEQYSTLRIDCDDARHRLDHVLQDAEDQLRPLLTNVSDQLSAALRKLEDRVGALEGGVGKQRGGERLHGPRPPTLGDVLTCVTSLAGRVSALEVPQTDVTVQMSECTVATYLAHFGLTEDVLRTLALNATHHSNLPATGGSISSGPGLTGAFGQAWRAPSNLSSSAATISSARHGIPSTMSALTPIPSTMSAIDASFASRGSHTGSVHAPSNAGGTSGDGAHRNRESR